jgi:hypothetical protein
MTHPSLPNELEIIIWNVTSEEEEEESSEANESWWTKESSFFLPSHPNQLPLTLING